MTPEETAAVIQAAFAAFNGGDLPAWLDALHPDIELRSRIVHPAGEEWFRGYAGARAWWEAIAGTYDETRLIPEAIVVDGDRAVITVRARFVVGDDVVEHGAWQAARFAGRRFRVWARFDTEEEAYAAAGIARGEGVRTP
jgi:ketosteroid isomerase-like protein